MIEKLKNFFNKDRIFVFICLLCIIAFCVLYAILYTNDKKQVLEHQSTIILNDDEKNLNTSWSINNDGNLVGDNLFNINSTNNDIIINNKVNVTFQNDNNPIYININAIQVPNNCYIQFWQLNNNIGSGAFDMQHSPSRIFSIDFNYINNGLSFYVENGSVIDQILLWHSLTSGTFTFYITISYTELTSYEPYGVWYSETNYDNLETQFDIISGNINPLSVNNISSNTLILNSIDVTSQLQGANFLSDISGGLGFYNTDFDGFSSFSEQGVNEFNLVSIFNRTYTIYGCTAFVSLSHSAEDYLDISLYRDNQLILVMSDLDSETTQDYMQQYGNQEIQFNKIIISGKYTDGLSNRQGTNYIVDNNNYAFGYQQGYKDSSMYYDAENTRLVGENAQLNNDLTNLDAQYTTLSNNYSSLLEQYNLLNSDKYTFTELFWSISAVPFGVLTSGFNVNVLGFNLAAIITGLFTSLLLIWLIKKFFK